MEPVPKGFIAVCSPKILNLERSFWNCLCLRSPGCQHAQPNERPDLETPDHCRRARAGVRSGWVVGFAERLYTPGADRGRVVQGVCYFVPGQLTPSVARGVTADENINCVPRNGHKCRAVPGQSNNKGSRAITIPSLDRKADTKTFSTHAYTQVFGRQPRSRSPRTLHR